MSAASDDRREIVHENYFRMPNEIVDAALRFGFSKRQLHVYFAVARKTYGYRKRWDDMTVQQIADLTKIPRQHVSGALSELVTLRAVLKRDGKHGYKLAINTRFGEWGSVPKQDASQNRTETVPKQDTQRTNPKGSRIDTREEKIPVDRFTQILCNEHGWHFGLFQGGPHFQMLLRWGRLNVTDDELRAAILSAHEYNGGKPDRPNFYDKQVQYLIDRRGKSVNENRSRNGSTPFERIRAGLAKQMLPDEPEPESGGTVIPGSYTHE